MAAHNCEESAYRIGGSTVCLKCGRKITTCCEGEQQ